MLIYWQTFRSGKVRILYTTLLFSIQPVHATLYEHIKYKHISIASSNPPERVPGNLKIRGVYWKMIGHRVYPPMNGPLLT